MLQLERALRRASQAAGDEHVIVAAPYDLSDQVCRELCAERVFSGYVANSAPSPSDRDQSIAGWWIHRRAGLWHLRHSIASTVVLLGASTHQEIESPTLHEARRKNIQRLLVTDTGGSGLRA